MRIGLSTRLPNGPESRALRTRLNLERRNLTQVINAQGLLSQKKCQNDDLKAWEADSGYPLALLRLMYALDEAVSHLATKIFAEGLSSDSVCNIVRPDADDIPGLLSMQDFGLILNSDCQAKLLGDGADFWQRLFDAVVARTADLCDRRNMRLTISALSDTRQPPDN